MNQGDQGSIEGRVAASRRASSPEAKSPVSDAFNRAWNESHTKLRDWLTSKRFSCRPHEVAEVFEQASAEVRKNDWAMCSAGSMALNTSGSRVGATGDGKLASSESAKKLLLAAFSRAVRTIEIRKWSQLILGEDKIPSGPLHLNQRWRESLPTFWRSEEPRVFDAVNGCLGELALAGWASLGSYGSQEDPASWFLNLLVSRLQRDESWESVLYSAKVTGSISLLEVLRREALREFYSSSDGERAFHWAIDHLIQKKFTAPGMRPVHEASNPIGFLRASFAKALVDFRREAWNPGQLQRPRPEKWMRQLGEDWVDIFKLVVRHARTEDVVHRFLSGEHRSTQPGDETDDADESSILKGGQGTESAGRMTEAARTYLTQALQIEEGFQGEPAARVRAIATLWRSYLELEKRWFPPIPSLSLVTTDGDGDDRPFNFASVERDPLMELVCAEDRRRLTGVERVQHENCDTEGNERALVRALLGQGFQLSEEEVALLKEVLAPSAKKAGRPRKDAAEARENLLARLKQALHNADIDVSILDSVSVAFHYQHDESLADSHLGRPNNLPERATTTGADAGTGEKHDQNR
jgi:hypothetical protein